MDRGTPEPILVSLCYDFTCPFATGHHCYNTQGTQLPQGAGGVSKGGKLA